MLLAIPVCLALVSLVVAHDPQPKDSAPPSALRQFMEQGLRDAQAPVLLQELCSTAPKRLSGSAGLDQALVWGEAALKKAGAAKVYRVPTMVPHWERGGVASLAIVGEPEGARTFLPILALGGSDGTPEGGLEAPVVRAVGREQLAALGAKAKGAIVFLDEPFDPGCLDTGEAYGKAVWQRGRGAVEAAKLGAVAVIVRSVTAAHDDHPHTGAMRYEDGVPRIPAAAVSTLGADRLAAKLAAGPLRLKLALSCRNLPDAPSANVVGELPGTDPAAGVVVIGGHIDAWESGDGAHDDASGCAHAIEALRLLAKSGWRGKRTLRVVLYTNEENGLRGGTAQRDATPMGEVRLAIESDSGGFAPVGLSLSASGPLKASFAEFGKQLDPIFAGLVVAGGGGADVGPLKDRGAVVGSLVVNDARYFDFHHAAIDVASAVHPRELQLGAVALACWARHGCELADEVYAAEREHAERAASGK